MTAAKRYSFPSLHALLCLLAGAVTSGCGSGYQDAAPAIPPAPPPQAVSEIWNGYFYGTATVDGADRYSEALLTLDGAVRVHIDGPSGPEGSVQFVGRMATTGERSGTGTVIGQHCALNPGRFCTASGPGEIRIANGTRTQLSGEIRVTTSGGTETWPFRMHWPDIRPAIAASATGQYRETRAEFARGEDLTITVDGARALFFQSAATGCVGNGALAPTPIERSNGYDATLTIENCTGPYASMNGRFEGVATRWMGDGPYGEIGSWLLIWISSADPAATRVAVTMWGDDPTCRGCWDY